MSQKGRSSASRYTAVLALLSLAPSLYAQQPPAPLIRANSRLILLDIVVTDKAGHPVRRLTRGDFTIYENQTPQKIASFESASTPGVAPSTSAPRTVILLDQLNTSFADLAYARDSILQFLNRDSADNQPTALLSLGLRGLVIAQDFTQDRKLLKDKLVHLTALNANSKGNMDINWAPEYAQAALSALMQIARSAVASPYSLNVIWVTSGFAGILSSANTNEADSGLRALANLLVRSRMRLYTIDPAGVVPKIPMGGIAAPNGVSRGSELDAKESSSAKLVNSAGSEAAEADVLLSHMTAVMGGLSYYGRNDVEQALRQAVLDGSSSYLISYAPSNTDFDGKYRKIEIHTTVEGATARTRQGYYAVPDEAAPDPRLTETRLQTAMSSPLTYTGVDVSCPAVFDPQKDHLTGKLVITPRPLLPMTDTHEQILRISSFSKDRKPLNVWSWRINWKDPWTNHVVSASFDKVLSPKSAVVRFLVADPSAERIGTCEYRLP